MLVAGFLLFDKFVRFVLVIVLDHIVFAVSLTAHLRIHHDFFILFLVLVFVVIVVFVNVFGLLLQNVAAAASSEDLLNFLGTDGLGLLDHFS